MKSPLLFLALVAVVLAQTPAPADKLFAVQFTTGPGWDASKPFSEQKYLKEHSANLNRMWAENRIVSGGRHGEVGLLIMRAPDEAALRAQLAQDPSIAAGTFNAKVEEYRPFFGGQIRAPAAAPSTTVARTAPATDEKSAAPKLKQFIYVLRLVPRLHDDSAWTDADRKVIGAHFAHLQAATKDGKVILGGRTLEGGDKTFGLVIFEAPDEAAARAFMNSDPAVVEKIMTAEVHPYAVALTRK